MLKIEFLYYNKNTCNRCASTNESVILSLKELKDAINKTDLKIDLKEKKLPKSKIHLSPSILINGKDIEKIVNKTSKLKSNKCLDCCQLVGHPVNCRTFTYKGKAYDYIPKEMILEAIKISSKT
ncbi:MAG: DUF2703 domain-containing protein [Candidatus Altiarchaeota archaeon]